MEERRVTGTETEEETEEEVETLTLTETETETEEETVTETERQRTDLRSAAVTVSEPSDEKVAAGFSLTKHICKSDSWQHDEIA